MGIWIIRSDVKKATQYWTYWSLLKSQICAQPRHSSTINQKDDVRRSEKVNVVQYTLALQLCARECILTTSRGTSFGHDMPNRKHWRRVRQSSKNNVQSTIEATRSHAIPNYCCWSMRASRKTDGGGKFGRPLFPIRNLLPISPQQHCSYTLIGLHFILQNGKNFLMEQVSVLKGFRMMTSITHASWRYCLSMRRQH